MQQLRSEDDLNACFQKMAGEGGKTKGGTAAKAAKAAKGKAARAKAAKAAKGKAAKGKAGGKAAKAGSSGGDEGDEDDEDDDEDEDEEDEDEDEMEEEKGVDAPPAPKKQGIKAGYQIDSSLASKLSALTGGLGENVVDFMRDVICSTPIGGNFPFLASEKANLADSFDDDVQKSITAAKYVKATCTVSAMARTRRELATARRELTEAAPSPP